MAALPKPKRFIPISTIESATIETARIVSKKYVHVYLTLTSGEKVGQAWFENTPSDFASPLTKMLGSAAVHDRTAATHARA
jgi:hypothetical protein